MQTKDAIKFALTVSNGAVLSEIDEMSDATLRGRNKRSRKRC